MVAGMPLEICLVEPVGLNCKFVYDVVEEIMPRCFTVSTPTVFDSDESKRTDELSELSRWLFSANNH
jgi:hypothetical protein